MITDEVSNSDNRLEVSIWNIQVAHLEVEHPTVLSDRLSSTGNCTIKWKPYARLVFVSFEFKINAPKI